MNGFFHGQLLFCSKEELVFCVQLKDITKNAGKEYIQSCKDDIDLRTLRRKITKANMEKVRVAIGNP